MLAGGTAYYFAKKDIDAHRREQELKGIRGTEYLECSIPIPLALQQLVSVRQQYNWQTLATVRITTSPDCVE